MDIQIGDKVRLKPKELRKHAHLGMEYATVTKVFTSQHNGKKTYNLLSHTLQELKMVPENELVFIAEGKKTA